MKEALLIFSVDGCHTGILVRSSLSSNQSCAPAGSWFLPCQPVEADEWTTKGVASYIPSLQFELPGAPPSAPREPKAASACSFTGYPLQPRQKLATRCRLCQQVGPVSIGNSARGMRGGCSYARPAPAAAARSSAQRGLGSGGPARIAVGRTASPTRTMPRCRAVRFQLQAGRARGGAQPAAGHDSCLRGRGGSTSDTLLACVRCATTVTSPGSHSGPPPAQPQPPPPSPAQISSPQPSPEENRPPEVGGRVPAQRAPAALLPQRG